MCDVTGERNLPFWAWPSSLGNVAWHSPDMKWEKNREILFTYELINKTNSCAIALDMQESSIKKKKKKKKKTFTRRELQLLSWMFFTYLHEVEKTIQEQHWKYTWLISSPFCLLHTCSIRLYLLFCLEINPLWSRVCGSATWWAFCPLFLKQP